MPHDKNAWRDDLTDTEKALAAAAAAGKTLDLTKAAGNALGIAWPAALSQKWEDDRAAVTEADFLAACAIRGLVLREICLGLNGAPAITAKGVRVVGAAVEGTLDFEDEDIERPLVLALCWLKEALILRRAKATVASFVKSRLDRIDADRLSSAHDLVLRGAHIAGGVKLRGASLGGNLDCTGAHIGTAGGVALMAAGARIEGYVLLRNGFRANGAVNFFGATIGGNLECVSRSEHRRKSRMRRCKLRMPARACSAP